MLMPSDLPFSVTQADVTAALASLGLATDALVSLLIEPRRLSVTYARRDDKGEWLAAGNGLATATTTIDISPGDD